MFHDTPRYEPSEFPRRTDREPALKGFEVKLDQICQILRTDSRKMTMTDETVQEYQQPGWQVDLTSDHLMCEKKVDGDSPSRN
jgi:hypothetical protein